MNPKSIDPENPRDVDEIRQDIEELPDYWGFGVFGEHDLFTELAAALAEQDEEEWGELEEQYPETVERLES